MFGAIGDLIITSQQPLSARENVMPTMKTLLVSAIAAFTTLLAIAPASAQRGPYFDRSSPSGQQGRDQGAGLPGKFDYYALVLSWSPSYCASLTRNDYDPQCHRRDGKRYAFVLHGLWPQYDKGYPQYCPTRDRPFVPQSVIDRMMDIMPSQKLAIHEYKKHGTCSGLDPAGYYDVSRNLFGKVKIPARYQNTQAAMFVSPGELVQDFIAINPGMKPDMLSVACEPRSGNRLKEIRVCFSKDGELRSCGRNEEPRRLCSADKMYVPPVRVPPGGSIENVQPNTAPKPSGLRSL
jgi:ribonuclease T2